MTKEQALRLLDIIANAFASSTPIAERADLMAALTNLRTEIANHGIETKGD
jgi:hypothetical protein